MSNVARIPGFVLPVVALLAAGAACGPGGGDTGGAAGNDGEGKDLALGPTCTNQTFGFEVAYPTGWVVNRGAGLPPCSAFDPQDASMPAASEIPTRIAIAIHRDDVPFGRVTDFAADPTVDAVSRREATVDGRPAMVAELEHTGGGMYPAGHRSYSYFIDLDGLTLMAVTHDVDAAAPPSYDERRRLLDEMMASIRFR